MIANGHLEALEGEHEGAEEAVLVRRKEALDLPTDTGARVSVAQVARRHAMNSNQIFTWLRDQRFPPAEVDASGDPGDENLFLPVEITGLASEPDPGFDLEVPGPTGRVA